MIATALQFGGIVDASPGMKAIAENAVAALRMIGAESEINAHRVAKYGIARTEDTKEVGDAERLSRPRSNAEKLSL